jgi:hypothetical protein
MPSGDIPLKMKPVLVAILAVLIILSGGSICLANALRESFAPVVFVQKGKLVSGDFWTQRWYFIQWKDNQ